MNVTKVFEFDSCLYTDKFREFKNDYSVNMTKALDFNTLETLIEGIKSGLHSSYEYISDGQIYLEPEGIEDGTDVFSVLIKPKGNVDKDKMYFYPNELEVVISYEEHM